MVQEGREQITKKPPHTNRLISKNNVGSSLSHSLLIQFLLLPTTETFSRNRALQHSNIALSCQNSRTIIVYNTCTWIPYSFKVLSVLNVLIFSIAKVEKSPKFNKNHIIVERVDSNKIIDTIKYNQRIYLRLLSCSDDHRGNMQTRGYEMTTDPGPRNTF